MSIVLLGSTSGSCTLQELAVAGTSVLTLPVGTGTVVANNVNSAIVSGTAVASTSGTSIDFTSIPSWVKRITVMLDEVSSNGITNYLIQLGDSGGIETTGYVGSGSRLSGGVTTTASYTAGMGLNNGVAATTYSGKFLWESFGSNTWIGSGVFAGNDTSTFVTASAKTLSATLDRVRITTANGTDTFDAGSINILYE